MPLFSARPTLGSRIALATVLALLASAPSTLAQDAVQPREVTFSEAVRIALDQNLTLRRTENAVETQEAFLSDARMAYYPFLSASTGLSRNYGRFIDRQENQIVNEATSFYSAGVNAGVTLFDGYRRGAQLDQARFGVEATSADLERQRETVVFNVMSQYLTLMEQREQIAIRRENLVSQQQQLERIEAFVEAGSRAASDLYQQRSQVANARVALGEAERLARRSENSLIQTLALDPLRAYTFVAPTLGDAPLDAQGYDPETLLRTALDQRADIAAQETRIRSAQQGIRIARSSILPTLSASAGYNSSWSSLAQDPVFGVDGAGNPTVIGSQDVAFFDQLDRNRGGSVSLNLSYDLFDRFQRRNGTQRARVQLDDARLSLETLRQDVALQVRQAYLDYQSDLDQLGATEAALEAAELLLEVEQERYNVGASTIVELTQARTALVEAQSNRAQAVFRFLFRDKVIDYYQGTLDPTARLFE